MRSEVTARCHSFLPRMTKTARLSFATQLSLSFTSRSVDWNPRLKPISRCPADRLHPRDMAMEFLFGKRKTPADLLRENKRMLDKAIRELDRERMGLQNQDKKIVADIKKMAKEGQMAAVKVMAKSLIRNRHAVTKMHGLKSQLQAVSLRLATLKSTQAMADAMRGATKVGGSMCWQRTDRQGHLAPTPCSAGLD
ncbi:uncharacterized protein HaLaN_22221 [Haematococcus lacustris]|uniref:Charged multivesicular body protein 2a n=1 Tax=Haematococcus lacustris TaxID=44745 RepID=A0A699ZZR2_HAELA|nr:uncharacterized protein HaLaN_22221 [Haematococcus lacustris]